MINELIKMSKIILPVTDRSIASFFWILNGIEVSTNTPINILIIEQQTTQPRP